MTVGCSSAAAGQPSPKAATGKPPPRAAAGKLSPKARLVTWNRGESIRGVRFWIFRNDVQKGQTFALFDRNGLVATAKVVAFEQPYANKPCFRIVHAMATTIPSWEGSVVAYGPLEDIPQKARAVDLSANTALAASRELVGLDLDGDGEADFALAGPNCQHSDGYDWCVDSYVRAKPGWRTIEHYFDAEGCRGK